MDVIPFPASPARPDPAPRPYSSLPLSLPQQAYVLGILARATALAAQREQSDALSARERLGSAQDVAEPVRERADAADPSGGMEGDHLGREAGVELGHARHEVEGLQTQLQRQDMGGGIVGLGDGNIGHGQAPVSAPREVAPAASESSPPIWRPARRAVALGLVIDALIIALALAVAGVRIPGVHL